MSRSSDSQHRAVRSGARTIGTLDDLAAALPLRHGDVVALDAGVLSTARQDRLNGQLGECGCDAGERGAARGLLLAGCLCVATGGRLRSLRTLAIGGFCGAGLGKFLGRRAAVTAASRAATGVVRVGRGSRPGGARAGRTEGASGQLVADGRR